MWFRGRGVESARRSSSGARPSRAAVALVLLSGLPAAGATITVNTTADESGTNPGACSLREAITAANTNAPFGGCPAGSGPDTITLPAGTYTLTLPNSGGTNEDANATGDLDILESLTIQGAGAATTIIQAGTTNSNGIDKVIAVNPFCAAGVVVVIDAVTVRFGRNTQPFGASDFSYTGAGIDWCAGSSGSSFTLSNAVVSDNTNVHGYGGGLNIDSFPGSSTVMITNVNFQNNTVAADATTSQGTGAGINIFTDHSTVTITDSTFTGNQAQRPNAGGGGLAYRPTSSSSLQVTRCTFDSNTAQGIGGGIWVSGLSAATTVTILDSQVTNNHATTSQGGGLVLDSVPSNTTPYQLTNLLVSGNGAGGPGGGVYVGSANVAMSRSRIVGNTATAGSGLYKNVDTATVTASGNWWGCSTGPSAAPCDLAAAIGGTLTSSPWLRDQLGPGAALVTNQSASLTASFLTDSSGGSVPVANLSRLIGQPVTWAASTGTLSLQQATVQAAGTATAAYTAAGPGSPVISARVDNDNTAPISSNVVSLTVGKAATTAAVVSDSPDPSVVGQTVAITATVAGQFGNTPTAPTGTISVTDGVQACTIVLPAASCAIGISSVGARSLTATYNGDTAFLASAASSAAPHTVNKADTTTTISSDAPDPSIVGQGVTVAYAVTVNAPGSGAPGGNVTVSDGVNSCTGTVAAGQCTLVLATLGSRTLTAAYAGDASFNGSTSADAPHQVNKPDTTTTITSDGPDPSLTGQSVTVVYGVTVNPPGSGTPGGNVTVSDGVISCTGTVAAGQCSLVFTSVGARTLTATYAGDASFNGSTSAGAPHQVNKPDTTTTITSDLPDPSLTGQSVTVAYGVTVNSPGSGTPGGNVTVSDGAISCTGTVAAGQCSLVFTAVGARTLTATYAGDASFNGSTSAGAPHQVNKPDTTTTITSDLPDPSVTGQSVTIVYGVAVNPPGSGTPGGNVTVSDGVISCTGTVAAGQCSLTFTSPGSRTLTATYAGDAAFNGSASAGEPHGVGKAGTTTTITSDLPDPSMVGQGVVVLFTVAAAAPGAGTPTGNVTVSDGVDSCTGTVASGTCTLSLSTGGSRPLAATYAGDGSFGGSVSPSVSHSVSQISTTTAIGSDAPDPSVAGQGVAVAVTVTTASGTATGTVLVDDGVGDSCSAPLSLGAGSCTLTPTQAGSLTLTASYPGDATHSSSQGTAPHQVNRAGATLQLLTVVPGRVLAGSAVTVRFVLSAAPPGSGSPTGPVTVDDGQGATCSAPAATGECTLTLGPPGPRTLTASYPGDAAFLPATSESPLQVQVDASTIPAASGAGLALLAAGLAAAGAFLLRRLSPGAS